MITYAEAIELIGAEVWTMPTELVPVSESLGRALAGTTYAPFDLPMFDNSAVDGYGVHAEDLAKAARLGPVELELVGTSQAGRPLSIAVPPGRVAQVLTGAPIPLGVDSVVMQEDVVRENGCVRFTHPAVAGANIRRQGEEFRSGDTLFQIGTLVNPPILAALSSLGFIEVEVYRLPRVGILTTGDELAGPGESLKPGMIYESNSAGLAAALSAVGIRNIETWRVRDELETTEAALAELLATCDIVLTTGGVSVGDYDTVKPALTNLGAREVFWRCAVKPGKPIWFGRWESEGHFALVFGLPGNPVSALVTFAMFAMPAIRAMSGLGFAPQPTVPAALSEPLSKSAGRLEFVRCRLEALNGRYVAAPIQKRASHMLGSMGPAEGLIHFPLEATTLDMGQKVEVTPLRWGWV